MGCMQAHQPTMHTANPAKLLTRRSLLAGAAAGAAALALGACSTNSENDTNAQVSPQTTGASTSYEAFALATASYPEMAQYPDEQAYMDSDGTLDSDDFNEAYTAWREGREAQTTQLEEQPEATKALSAFFSESLALLMPEGDDATANRACSPLNVWLALALLAQITAGTSQQQVVEVLGASDAKSACELAEAAWDAAYCDDGAVKSVLANSVWLSDALTYEQEPLDTLAQRLHATTFSGAMGSADYDQALQDWLSAQTGGLLAERAADVTMDALTVVELASTIWYKARWLNEFSASATQRASFHAPEGDVEADFMHASPETNYYWGESFGAVRLNLLESGSMWLLLPDEGVEASELLGDAEALGLMQSSVGDSIENSTYLIVHLALPKFDVSAQVDLLDALEAMGITELLDAETADFSALLDESDGVCLSAATHAVRVKVDEEGVEAAAFTVMSASGASMPPDEEMDFVLDRPFVFAIVNESGLPLFTGLVNQP